MISNVIEKKICNSFSDAAMKYDMLTGLHKRIGRELIEKIRNNDPSMPVLDIGMGTGWFTHELTNLFPRAMVVGLDFAPGMIARARRREGAFKIVCANASSLPFKESAFDIIASNLVYQWIEDLPRALGLCRSRLSKRGALFLTMFGRDTFQELFAALDVCADKQDKRNSLAIHRLADKNQVIDALKEAGFDNLCVEAKRMKVRFPDMMSLVKWIKDIGANALPKDVYLGKDLLARANDYYNTHFKDRLGVYATFEVIWVEAKR